MLSFLKGYALKKKEHLGRQKAGDAYRAFDRQWSLEPPVGNDPNDPDEIRKDAYATVACHYALQSPFPEGKRTPVSPEYSIPNWAIRFVACSAVTEAL